MNESERKLATLISNLPGIAYRCRNDAQWTMEFVSQGSQELTGYKAEDLVENKVMDFNSLILPGDRFKIRKEIDIQMARNAHFEVVYRIKKPDNRIAWLWERGKGIPDESGQVTAIEGFITDITKMKEAERQLIEKDKALEKLKDQLEEETIYLRQEIKVHSNFEEIICHSDLFKKVLMQIEQVASTDSTVLIQGETGTGKELIARAIHNNSNRSQRSLVTINCAALPPELIESELFGHTRGAFTGAYNDKTGKFQLADKGTIFLDEIGELPINLQAKILRVLQENEFEKLGSSKTIKTDVRVIAATNRNLEKAIQQGDFRSDLYYRLNVFPIHVPPLRDRKEDIPLLVKFFVRKYSTKTGRKIQQTSKKVLRELQAYDWPGNVRELENIIERAIVLCRDDRLTAGSWIPRKTASVEKTICTLDENERHHILKALEATQWQVGGKNGAAQLLGIKRTTLQHRMKKLGIQKTK